MSGTEPSPHEQGLKLQPLLEIFGNKSRRSILRSLWEADESVTISHVINEVQQCDGSFQRDHLFRLEEAGCIDWNQELGVISKGPNFEAVESYLKARFAHTS